MATKSRGGFQHRIAKLEAERDRLKVSVESAHARIVELEDQLRRIRDVRDHRAEHGCNPDDDGPDEVNQGFDDWAADVADSALGEARSR